MSFWSLRKRLIAATVCTVCLLALVSLMFSDTRRISPTAAVKMPQVVRGNSTYHFPANNDSFTMTEILELCHSRSHENVALTITQRYALEAPLDAIRDDYLNTCHPIEISTSQGARSMGHCSDFAQYIYYGNARLSSDQYEASTFTLKTSKCSQSMYLHGEYLIWQILESKHKVKNLWMPNLEQVTANDLKHVENMDLILCKTKVTCEAFDALLKEKALPKSPKTIFMSHSTPDTYQNAVEHLGALHVQKMSRNYNKFFHAYGGSGRKSSVELVDCWLQHHTWPTLTIVGHHPKEYFVERFGGIPWNLRILGGLPTKQLRELQLANGIHICPSQQEGYGHYINEGRALGAMVMTTDHAPMNEFIVDGKSGILFNHSKPMAEPYQAMAPYFVSPVKLEPSHICQTVKRVLKLSIAERKRMGEKARLDYERDDELMKQNIKRLINGELF